MFYIFCPIFVIGIFYFLFKFYDPICDEDCKDYRRELKLKECRLDVVEFFTEHGGDLDFSVCEKYRANDK